MHSSLTASSVSETIRKLVWLTSDCDSTDALPYPSTMTILFRSLWPYIPMPILKYVKYTPTKDHVRFRKTLDVINAFAKTLIDEKTESVLAGKGENKKDIMSILGTCSTERRPHTLAKPSV